MFHCFFPVILCTVHLNNIPCTHASTSCLSPLAPSPLGMLWHIYLSSNRVAFISQLSHNQSNLVWGRQPVSGHMFRSWSKTHCSLKGCLHVDMCVYGMYVCVFVCVRVCAWAGATGGCVCFMAADGCCGAHAEPPLTQPTMFLSLG